MNRFENPMDPSKTTFENTIADGIRIHIFNSTLRVEEIMNFLKGKFDSHHIKSMTSRECLEYAMRELKIKREELIISDEKGLIDWIAFKK